MHACMAGGCQPPQSQDGRLPLACMHADLLWAPTESGWLLAPALLADPELVKQIGVKQFARFHDRAVLALLFGEAARGRRLEAQNCNMLVAKCVPLELNPNGRAEPPQHVTPLRSADGQGDAVEFIRC